MSSERIEVKGIPGVELIRPDVKRDRRGFFLEIFREEALGVPLIQGNHSHSSAGALRGLHFHGKQSDIWYVVSGAARVGLADLRTRSAHPAVATLDLSDEEPGAIFIPPGVAHGFAALTDLDLVYWVTHYFDGTDEHGLAWDDPTLSIPWEVSHPVLSGRDASAQMLDWDRVSKALA